MLQTHHCWKCRKAPSSRCFKKCGLRICSIHPNHAFGAGSSCRACQCLDHNDQVVEKKAENKAEEIDVLPEEWVGQEEQVRAWKLVEQLKLERGWEESWDHGAPKKVVEKNSATQDVKGRRGKHRR